MAVVEPQERPTEPVTAQDVINLAVDMGIGLTPWQEYLMREGEST